VAAPTKFTEDTIKRLEHAISLGAPYSHACRYAGISDETFRQWRESKDGFLGRMEKAEGKAVAGWLGKIERAASQGNWQAAAWKLERRYPADFGRREAIDVSGKHEHQHAGALPIAAVSDADMLVLRRLALAATNRLVLEAPAPNGHHP